MYGTKTDYMALKLITFEAVPHGNGKKGADLTLDLVGAIILKAFDGSFSDFSEELDAKLEMTKI